MSARPWFVDVYEGLRGREVTLRDEHWTATLEIDSDGDLRVEHEVDSDSYGGGTRNVRCFFPMAKVIDFLRECGYEVHPPTPPTGRP